MIFNSIRWRLQLWHGLILVVVLSGFGLSAYHVARDNQQRRIDTELEHHLMALFRPLPPDQCPNRPPPGEHPETSRRPDPFDFSENLSQAIEQAGALDQTQTNTFYYLLWQSDGVLMASAPGSPVSVPFPTNPEPAGIQPHDPDSLDDGPPPHPRPPLPLIARTRNQAREIYRFGPHGDCVLVGRSMASDLAAMNRLALWLVAAGASVLLLGLAGGWWVATRAIRPIEDISATAIKIAAGDLSQRINAADAESELGRLATVLNSTFARLEAAFAHQARFTADASHELRTPVSVILTQTQTALARERSVAEYRNVLDACQRAAQRMRSLIESLLELARLDAGQEPMKQAPFDLAHVVRESIELLRPLATARGIQIQCACSPAPCIGDSERIGQVATNLLTNAIQFNRAQGSVRVGVSAGNEFALLTVEDTGQGIPAEELPRIFERFYRVDKSRSRLQGHDGIGLAISKAIVDSHGGLIEVSSQFGAGSVFTVKLPTGKRSP